MSYAIVHCVAIVHSKRSQTEFVLHASLAFTEQDNLIVVLGKIRT